MALILVFPIVHHMFQIIMEKLQTRHAILAPPIAQLVLLIVVALNVRLQIIQMEQYISYLTLQVYV